MFRPRRCGFSSAPPRRAVLALLAAAAGLGACGFEPLYGRRRPREGEEAAPLQPVRAELAAVQLAGLDGRIGQILRNDLLDRLNPTGVEVPPQYLLRIRLRQSSHALAVQLDNTATRYDLILAANILLQRAADGQPLYGSLVRRVASYDIRRQPFATLVAQRDAERRAARAVSEDITTQLAVFFARGATAPAPVEMPPE